MEMNRKLTEIILVLSFLVSAAIAPAQEKTALKDCMDFLHGKFGVNFIYDSSLDIDRPYAGERIDSIGNLDAALERLLEGTDISYDINRRYVVLTSKKKHRRNYEVFNEEEVLDTLAESRISATVDRRRNATQTGLKKIDRKTLNRGFAVLSSPDVIKTLQTLPGVAEGGGNVFRTVCTRGNRARQSFPA